MYFFSFTKKYHMRREGDPLMGSFHTQKLSFFPLLHFSFLFFFEIGNQKHC